MKIKVHGKEPQTKLITHKWVFAYNHCTLMCSILLFWTSVTLIGLISLANLWRNKVKRCCNLLIWAKFCSPQICLCSFFYECFSFVSKHGNRGRSFLIHFVALVMLVSIMQVIATQHHTTTQWFFHTRKVLCYFRYMGGTYQITLLTPQVRRVFWKIESPKLPIFDALSKIKKLKFIIWIPIVPKCIKQEN